MNELRKHQQASPLTREALCEALRSKWYLTDEEIDAILADRAFFQPYLREALARRATLGGVPESPTDQTDGHAIFLLTEMGDTSILPDLLQCLRMSEDELWRLYSDSLTEFMWIPFAKLGHGSLEKLWEFVTNTSVDIFARHAVVDGVVAMHHFHPESRATTVAFVERLLERTDCFPPDHLAGILCDCFDSGLIELGVRAAQFAAELRVSEEWESPMATAEDITRAIREGPQKDFISGRPHDVWGVNKQWRRWAEGHRQDEETILPDWVNAHRDLIEKVEAAASARFEAQHSAQAMREQYDLAMRLSEIITTEERLNELEDIAEADISGWLLDLPFQLAAVGLTQEAAMLGRTWAATTDRANFLGDRAVILAEAGLADEARRQIEEALREFPDDVWVRIKAGDAYYAIKEMELAERCYREALNLSDTSYDRDGALERLIPLLRELGKHDEADALVEEEETRSAEEEEPASKFTEDVENSWLPIRRDSPKVGRNDPCPCGSGKKYKKCHGK